MTGDDGAAAMQGVIHATQALEQGAFAAGLATHMAAFGTTALQLAANQEYAQTVDHVRCVDDRGLTTGAFPRRASSEFFGTAYPPK